MIKKLVLKLTDDARGYWFVADARTSSIQLEYIPLLFSESRNDFGVSSYQDEKSVLIWSYDSFKKQAKLKFKTDEEEYAFEEAYEKYYDKRWDEMPKVELSIQDWQNLQEKWSEIKKDKPNYVIFSLDDSGPLDKVEIYGKDELSQEDIAYIKQEHEKYLKYEKARQKYIAQHPDYSDVWRGPQDDEYEADIMKYYDQD